MPQKWHKQPFPVSRREYYEKL